MSRWGLSAKQLNRRAADSYVRALHRHWARKDARRHAQLTPERIALVGVQRDAQGRLVPVGEPVVLEVRA